ncbi:MAG: DUF302 domain-containing protein [Chloroflexi bacterium]|nr:DUF302 domain-containing protein [Chloroflexota bacterium]
MQLGLTVTLNATFEAAQERVTAALKAEGFGILTEIDVKATMKQKLDANFRPYKILGACNPPLAHRALTTAPEVGLLLPCNVTLDQVEPGRVQVSLIDPMMMMSVIPNEALAAISAEARARLERVVASLES